MREFSDLRAEVQDAIKQFCNEIMNQNIIGIFIVGSQVNRRPDKNSDVDILVVMEESDYRERGNRYYKDVEVEYFMNPVDQIHHYIQTESLLRPNTAHMISTGLLYFLREGFEDVIKGIVDDANVKIKNPLPELSKNEIELMKYSLDDIHKDLMDIASNKLVLNLTIHTLINISICIFLRIHRCIQERMKVIDDQLQKLDPRFFDLFSAVVSERSLDSAISLIDYLNFLLGGSRTKDWKLISELTI